MWSKRLGTCEQSRQWKRTVEVMGESGSGTASSHWELEGEGNGAAGLEDEEFPVAELLQREQEQQDGVKGFSLPHAGFLGHDLACSSLQPSTSRRSEASLFLPSEQDLTVRFLHQPGMGSASEDLPNSVEGPLLGRQTAETFENIAGGYDDWLTQSSADLRACTMSRQLAGSEDLESSKLRAENMPELELDFSHDKSSRTSKLESHMMDAECESEPALQGRMPNPVGLSASGPSRVTDTVPKRTKLVAFHSRRRNREIEAFELHVKELRKEIYAGFARNEHKKNLMTIMTAENGEMFDGEARMDLTDDLLHKVFSYLDDKSLCRAAMVCRQWRVASSHEDFWKKLNFQGLKVSHKQVRNLCYRFPNAVELNLRCTLCVDESLVVDAMRSLRGLEVLSLGKGLYSDDFFHALAIECSRLRKLSIADAVLGSGGSQEIQIRHESLQKLDILKCRVPRVAIRCPHLQELSLTRTGTAGANLHCPRLQTLDVSSCHKLSDSGVRTAATACPLLSELNISHCSYVTDETLREIAAACSNLRRLDASYCPNISLEGVRMSMLVSMTLRNCEGINSSSMTALSHCFMLEELLLDFCWLLTTVVLDLPRLRSISLSNCRKFVELTLRTPALVSINVTNCQTLNKIDITSTSLQKLVLNQQQGLATIALHCPSLHEVDFTECDSLTNSLCEVFSSGGGCPRLSSLILDNCEGLTAIQLSTTSLLCLSLVGCRKVCSIDLVCPNLRRLQLDGCDHLSTASLCPVGLRSLNLGICPHLTTLTIKADELTALDLRGCGILHQAEIVCPSLLSLDASYCSQLGDDCLAATTGACPLIQSLVLASCPSVGASGLLALQKLSGLTVLDLSYTFLTDLLPIYDACPQLEVLRLSACKYLANDALVALHGGNLLPNLQELDLSYGSLDRTAIEGLLSECPHLKHISLNGCSNVYDLNWHCVGQDQLNEYVTEDTQMVEASTHVDDVGESGQQAMDVSADKCLVEAEKNTAEAHLYNIEGSEVTVRCMEGLDESPGSFGECSESGQTFDKALQTLNCVGCPNIKRVIIPSSAGCVHLSYLNLSLSTNIKEVRLACSNLIALNLSNCVNLMELKLDCPRLMSLCLQASGIEAGELEQALKTCGLLETLDVRNCPKITSIALPRLRHICSGIKRLYNTLIS